MIFAVFLSVAINTAVALFHNSRKFCTSLSYHNFFVLKMAATTIMDFQKFAILMFSQL